MCRAEHCGARRRRGSVNPQLASKWSVKIAQIPSGARRAPLPRDVQHTPGALPRAHACIAAGFVAAVTPTAQRLLFACGQFCCCSLPDVQCMHPGCSSSAHVLPTPLLSHAVQCKPCKEAEITRPGLCVAFLSENVPILFIFLQKRRWGEEPGELMHAQPISCSDAPTAVLPTGLREQECTSPLIRGDGEGVPPAHQVLG